MITKNIILILAIATFVVNRLFQIQSIIGFASESPNPIMRMRCRKKIHINLLISIAITMTIILTRLQTNILLEAIIAIVAALVIEVLTFLITVAIDYLK